MCLCLYLISQVFPRDLGAVGLGGTPETWRTGLNALVRQMMAFLIRPSFLSGSALVVPNTPAFPMFYTDTSIPPVSPTPWVSLQAIAHIAPSFILPPFSLLLFKSQLKQHLPCGTAPGSPGDLLHAWFILYPPLWHPFNALSVFACLTPITL